MTDRELLEPAAKAAGIEVVFSKSEDIRPRNKNTWEAWNPIDDDGDALRLAVKMGFINPGCWPICTFEDLEKGNNDWNAATRRAITRAAAEIGKAMK